MSNTEEDMVEMIESLLGSSLSLLTPWNVHEVGEFEH